jgi:hypothetical protein
MVDHAGPGHLAEPASGDGGHAPHPDAHVDQEHADTLWIAQWCFAPQIECLEEASGFQENGVYPHPGGGRAEVPGSFAVPATPSPYRGGDAVKGDGEKERGAEAKSRAESVYAKFLGDGGLDFESLLARHPEISVELRRLHSQLRLFRPHVSRVAEAMAVDYPLDVSENSGTGGGPPRDYRGERFEERYRIERKLGSGGMAEVFLATDEKVGRHVAVKVPHSHLLGDETFVERFHRETRSLIRLEHPRIVKILDVGEHEGAPFAVMQYLPGGSLRDRLKAKAAPCTVEEVAEWLPAVAESLDFLQDQNLVHRDVKPGNILFDESGNAFLADFGIAKILGGTDTGLTMTGATPGTPYYMAPEIAEEEPLGPTYDQYALATIVYEALTGERPFHADTPMRLLLLKAKSEPRPIEAGLAPPAVVSAVMRGLHRNPRKRFSRSCLLARAVIEPAPASGVVGRWVSFVSLWRNGVAEYMSGVSRETLWRIAGLGAVGIVSLTAWFALSGAGEDRNVLGIPPEGPGSGLGEDDEGRIVIDPRPDLTKHGSGLPGDTNAGTGYVLDEGKEKPGNTSVVGVSVPKLIIEDCTYKLKASPDSVDGVVAMFTIKASGNFTAAEINGKACSIQNGAVSGELKLPDEGTDVVIVIRDREGRASDSYPRRIEREELEPWDVALTPGLEKRTFGRECRLAWNSDQPFEYAWVNGDAANVTAGKTIEASLSFPKDRWGKTQKQVPIKLVLVTDEAERRNWSGEIAVDFQPPEIDTLFVGRHRIEELDPGRSYKVDAEFTLKGTADEKLRRVTVGKKTWWPRESGRATDFEFSQCKIGDSDSSLKIVLVDECGNDNTVFVSVEPDLSVPKLTFDPATASKTSRSRKVLEILSDKHLDGVTFIHYQGNNREQIAGGGGKKWRTTLHLRPGLNQVRVIAVDGFGREFRKHEWCIKYDPE